jgi:hypothetical protein
MGPFGKTSTEHINATMNESVAEQKPIDSIETAKKQFQTIDALRYIQNNTYSGDPASLLGKIFYEKIGESELKRWALSITPVIDEKSVLKEPITRMELIIDNKVAANIEFLTFISSSANSQEVFEIKVIDNAVARLVDSGDNWENCLTNWMKSTFNQDLINHTKVKSIGIVTGVVQKFIISKKYKKFDISAKGGAYGVNVGGELYTSTSQYEFNTCYGVDLVYLPTKSTIDFEEKIKQGVKIEDKVELQALNKMLNVVKAGTFFA